MKHAGSLGAIGDIISQLLNVFTSPNYFLPSFSTSPFDALITRLRIFGFTYDVRRTMLFALVNGLYIAPVIHSWFEFLNRLPVPTVFASTPARRAIFQILIDQTVGAILISIGFFVAFEIAQQLVPLSLSPSPSAVSAMFSSIVKQPITSLNPVYIGSLLTAMASRTMLTVTTILTSSVSAMKLHLWGSLVAGRCYWPGTVQNSMSILYYR